MRISLIIPNWNGAEKLKKHLPFVLQAAKENSIDEVIVADDASSDNSLQILSDNFPDAKIIKQSKNLGFSSNVNSAVNQAIGELIILLNSDAHPQKDFFKYVLPHFDNPKVFSVGCNVGGSWSWANFKEGFFWHYQNEKIENKSHQTLWVSGGSGIFRKKIWQELEGLDSLFNPFYEEDVDLGYRATKRGYINIWEPASKVEHYKEPGVISANFSKDYIQRIAQRNQLIFIWKNITSKKLITEHKKALSKKLVTSPKYWSVFLSASIKLPQILPKREMEAKMAKLSDEEVLLLFNN